jgi:uncharacterized protein (DUF433 family)
MSHADIVTISPENMSRAPVFWGTRVPIQTLLDYLKAGDSIDEFLEGFPTVSREQVIAFLDGAEVVSVEVQPESEVERMAGNFQNDPTWDDFQASIAAYRAEVDAELELEYRQMDEMDQRQASDFDRVTGLQIDDWSIQRLL